MLATEVDQALGQLLRQHGNTVLLQEGLAELAGQQADSLIVSGKGAAGGFKIVGGEDNTGHER